MTTICHTCGGWGHLPQTPPPFTGFGYDDATAWVVTRCPTCDGEGTIPQGKEVRSHGHEVSQEGRQEEARQEDGKEGR